MKTVKLEVIFEKTSKRLELLVRIFYFIPITIFMYALFIFSTFLTFFQFFHILFSGKKNELLWSIPAMFSRELFLSYSYIFLLCEKKPVYGAIVEIMFDELSPRKELLLRIPYFFALFIVHWVLSIVSFATIFLQYLSVILTGEKNKFLHDLILIYLKYKVQFYAYIMLVTDERPNIFPF